MEIRTGVTVNKIALANYTAYNQTVAEANALDRVLYQDLTALNAALAVDVSDKNMTEQAEAEAEVGVGVGVGVDVQPQAILEAITDLKEKTTVPPVEPLNPPAETPTETTVKPAQLQQAHKICKSPKFLKQEKRRLSFLQ